MGRLRDDAQSSWAFAAPGRRRAARPATPPARDDDRAALIAELRDLAARGVRIVPRGLRAVSGERVLRACYALFGSLPRARAAAGLDAPARLGAGRMTREEVLAALRAETEAHDLPPMMSALPRELRLSITHQFGSYRAALDAIGRRARTGAQRWTRTSVVAALVAHERAGRPLTSSTLQATRADLANAIIRHIGSYSRAFALARAASPTDDRPTTGATGIASELTVDVGVRIERLATSITAATRRELARAIDLARDDLDRRLRDVVAALAAP
ncbi:MAG: hypothetical protein K8W52_02505 [Deltaproteobacteria bacterium]|nr:hypothetical protein [Deltaproteobacteria bacterium]